MYIHQGWAKHGTDTPTRKSQHDTDRQILTRHGSRQHDTDTQAQHRPTRLTRAPCPTRTTRTRLTCETWPSHGRHVCCVTQQTCLLCHTAEMSAVSHSRDVCCVTQQSCLLCHAADMSAASHSRHVCCVTQQTCLLCHTADMSEV